MGLFDYVELPFECQNCKNKEKKHEWQTKALQNAMIHYKPGSVASAYELEISEGLAEICTHCSKCEKFTDAKVKIENGKITDKVIYSKNEENK